MQTTEPTLGAQKAKQPCFQMQVRAADSILQMSCHSQFYPFSCCFFLKNCWDLMFSCDFLARMDYFFLIYPFSRTNGKSSGVSPLTRQCWQHPARCALFDGFVTVHGTSRCSRYMLSTAVGHKYFLFCRNCCCAFACHSLYTLVSFNQSTGQTRPVSVLSLIPRDQNRRSALKAVLSRPQSSSMC